MLTTQYMLPHLCGWGEGKGEKQKGNGVRNEWDCRIAGCVCQPRTRSSFTNPAASITRVWHPVRRDVVEAIDLSASCWTFAQSRGIMSRRNHWTHVRDSHPLAFRRQTRTALAA